MLFTGAPSFPHLSAVLVVADLACPDSLQLCRTALVRWLEKNDFPEDTFGAGCALRLYGYPFAMLLLRCDDGRWFFRSTIQLQQLSIDSVYFMHTFREWCCHFVKNKFWVNFPQHP
jgi:hypothetical protein